MYDFSPVQHMLCRGIFLAYGNQPTASALGRDAAFADRDSRSLLRVWGIRDGAQPLLIGVAQPDGDGLTIDRTMSKQYLSSLGYWPALPEQYVADTQPPQKRAFFSHDACFRCALREPEIEIQDDAAYMIVSCCFSPQKKFIFSGIFSFCRIENGKAMLIWDKKRDCPVWTVPKENDAVT